MADCLCSVLSVKPYSGYYPACPKCIRKLKRIHTNKTENHMPQETAKNLARFMCKFCSHSYSLEHVILNYCLALTITDGRVVSDVVLFGSRLNSVFGMPALNLNQFLLSEFSLAWPCLPLEDPYVSGYVTKAISFVVTGKVFKFRFNLPHNRPAQPSSLCEVCESAAGGFIDAGGPVKASSLQRVSSLVAIYFEPAHTVEASLTVDMALRSLLMDKENTVSPSSLSTVPRPPTDSKSRPLADSRPRPLTYYNQFDETDSCSSIMTTPINFDSYVAGDSLVNERDSLVKEMINGGSLVKERDSLVRKEINGGALIKERDSLVNEEINGGSLVKERDSLINEEINRDLLSLEDSLSDTDYQQLLDELKEEWLLTQSDSCTSTPPHSYTPIPPDSKSCVSPFWNGIPSTQDILQRNDEAKKDVSGSSPRQGIKTSVSSVRSPDTFVNSTKSNQDLAISGNTTSYQCSFGVSFLRPSFFSDTANSSLNNFVTPKLKKPAGKRQLLTATTPCLPPQLRPSHTPLVEFGLPSASSTPSVSLKVSKASVKDGGYVKMGKDKESRNSINGLSPDLL